MKALKYQLCRSALETIYLSFIRPLIEYGDIIFDNCSIFEKSELDKIQNEAARIVTGATKLVSIQNLNNETCWESLSSRRLKHKLILFYKMMHGLTPTFLSELIPQRVGAASNYNLRNADNFESIHTTCNTNSYHNSFLPSVIRAWNDLPNETKI